MRNRLRKNISLVTNDYSTDIKEVESKLNRAGYNTYILEKDFGWIMDYAAFSSLFLLFMPDKSVSDESVVDDIVNAGEILHDNNKNMILIGENDRKEELFDRFPDIMMSSAWLDKPVRMDELVPALEGAIVMNEL